MSTDWIISINDWLAYCPFDHLLILFFLIVNLHKYLKICDM